MEALAAIEVCGPIPDWYFSLFMVGREVLTQDSFLVGSDIHLSNVIITMVYP